MQPGRIAQQNAREYRGAKPRQFGNLHERMQFLIQLLQKHRREVPREIDVAIYDLETEVRHYKPTRPPYGQRSVIVGG